jgi:uncharacterized protein
VSSTAAQDRTLSMAGTRTETPASLTKVIEHAAHLLPSQGPITVFVHHNTIHAFEDLPFDEAVEKAQQVYGCEPYLSEDRYRQELADDRIRPDDLAAVLEDDLGDRADELIGLLGTRFHLRLAMLRHALYTAASPELRWVVAETDALRTFREDVPNELRKRTIEKTRHWIMRDFRNRDVQTADGCSPELQTVLSGLFETFDKADIEQWSDATWETFCLRLLWQSCYLGVQSAHRHAATPAAPLRPRDALLAVTDHDADELVHDLLIRFCAAFLDQGFAHWPLPQRNRGFYRSFLELYGQPGGVLPRWLGGLRQEIARLKRESVSPLTSIEESLELLGVGLRHREEFIAATLLALRGWAGMIWQLETNAEWIVWPAPKGTLVEFLAVRLLLDRFATRRVAKEELGYGGPLKDVICFAGRRQGRRTATGNTQRAFQFFQLAQVLGLTPEALYRLPAKTWGRLADEVDAYSELERRRTFQLAYERRYRHQTLDAIAVHAHRLASEQGAANHLPAFQVVFCLDEREESFRRHLEEIAPECETLSFAGFFAIAMYYRGAADAHAKPLCPVTIKPCHFIEEHPVYTAAESHRRRARTRQLLGAASHHVHRGSRSLVGGAVTALLGPLASLPLVARTLLPRTTAQIRRLFGRMIEPPQTQLLLERTDPEPGPEAGHIGYTVGEMADIVERVLRDAGFTRRLAPLIIICGHGSSSLNNPHEAAHDCGACGGARGGPNARAFAQMANDPRVRSILDGRGLNVPIEVVFVGAYHNTCDESVTYFDFDRLPLSHAAAFTAAREAVDKARQRNAHERCRRFESAPLSLTSEMALKHVEARAEDLSQVRPEYGHASNAITFVGRRSRTRGLYLDRRTFLASYDPTEDDQEYSILTRVLQPVFPVCGGISLEYYFSYVDPTGYGCGTKLPHNVTSLLGVMDGAASDLRPGLPWQMVEIHEPVRQLFIIETTPAAMMMILDRNPPIAALCRNEWVQLATLDPISPRIDWFHRGKFHQYKPETAELPEVASSADWYRGWRDHLGYAVVRHRS